jgi:hypothetical protein
VPTLFALARQAIKQPELGGHLKHGSGAGCGLSPWLQVRREICPIVAELSCSLSPSSTQPAATQVALASRNSHSAPHWAITKWSPHKRNGDGYGDTELNRDVASFKSGNSVYQRALYTLLNPFRLLDIVKLPSSAAVSLIL